MTDNNLALKMEYSKKENNLRQTLIIGWIPFHWRIALIYLGLITLAEAITTLIEPRVGIGLHGLVLVALILHAALIGKHVPGHFLLTLSLVPLIRLLSLAMPLRLFPQVYWYVIIGIPLFVAIYFTARIGNINRKMMGLTGKMLPLQVLIGLTGIWMGYLEYYILRPPALIPELRLGLIWLPALILLIFTGLLEELIFRGLLQYSSERFLGRYSIIYTSLVFTVLHLGYRSLLDLVFVFGVALFFAWVARQSGSIWGVTLAHGLINISLFLVYPFFITLK